MLSSDLGLQNESKSLMFQATKLVAFGYSCPRSFHWGNLVTSLFFLESLPSFFVQVLLPLVLPVC